MRRPQLSASPLGGGALYEVDENDRVVELKGAPAPDIGAPLPLVLADDWCLVLAYHVAEPDLSRAPPSAIVRFAHVWAHYLGLPNDEAFEGHPLASRGLEPYAASEVLESSWIRLLKRRNSVHRDHSESRFSGYRHFVFAFHDNTFECISRSIEFHGVQSTGVPEEMWRLLG